VWSIRTSKLNQQEIGLDLYSDCGFAFCAVLRRVQVKEKITDPTTQLKSLAQTSS
jgi:hypothetical protein